MPWKETCAVEQRLAFVREAVRDDVSKAELCRRYGISRPTGDKWLERFLLHGEAGLAECSSAPRHHPNQMPAELAAMIVSLRQEHMSWGPRKLLARLKRRQEGIAWPAASTIGQLLRRLGLSVCRKRRHRTPPYTQPFAGCDGPNATWCADFKGWFRTGDGAICQPLTITDAYSRYLIRCQGLERTRTTPVQGVFEAAFRERGLPRAIRTDNGSPFASHGIGGLSRLSIWWLKLGILPERIQPGKPQQNGRHERMHLTLKLETASPPEPTLRGQQRRFDQFKAEYNDVRPHEALGQRPPAELYQPSQRAYPSRLQEVSYPDQMEVRSVRPSGEIKWRGGRLYLSEALAHERVGLDPIDDGCWLVHFCRLPLAVLDERHRKLWTMELAMRKGLIARPGVPLPSAALQSVGTPGICKQGARSKT